MKKYIYIILLLAVTLMAAGCGNGDDYPPPVPYIPTLVRPTPAPPPDLTVPVGDPFHGFVPDQRDYVEIEFWHIQSGPQLAALRDMIEAFHANQPYVRVNEVRHLDDTHLFNALMMADGMGTLPHLAEATIFDIAFYRGLRMLLPLEPFMNDPVVGIGPAVKDDIILPFRETNIFDGYWYGLPFSMGVPLLFYNRNVLNAAGIGVPETWEALVNAVDTLTIGFDYIIDSEWISLLYQRGGRFGNRDGNVNFTSEAAIDAMEALMGLATHPNAQAVTGEAFAREEVAFLIAPSFLMPDITQTVGTAFNWGAVPFPGTDNNRAIEFSGHSIVMFENMNHGINARVGAWEFMRFTLDIEAAADWVLASGYVPTRNAVVNLPRLEQFFTMSTRAGAGAASLPHGFFRTRVAGSEYVRFILLEEMHEIRMGRISAEEGLYRAQERAEALFE